MNIINELELIFNSNKMDDFTKIRYIYLYVCKLFSYDTRVVFALPSLKKEIYEKELDVKNIKEFEIVCYTFSKILKDLLDHFGYKNEMIFDTDSRTFPHVHIVAYLGKRSIMLDPTRERDVARVKLNLKTYGFKQITDDSTFSDDLDDADLLMKKMDFYRSSSGSTMLNNLLSSFSFNDYEQDSLINFLNKFNAIVATVNVAKDLTRFDDVDYFLGYAINKMKLNEYRTIVKPAAFFRDDDPKLKELINIILIEFDKNPIFYIMEKVKNNYHIRLSNSEEVLEKLSCYSNYTNDEYFRNVAKRSLRK